MPRLQAGFCLGMSLIASSAFAQGVDCDTLADLCPANPIYDECILPRLEVASPCVVDFGDQRVVIQGTLRVPAGGILSFKSFRVTVEAPIRAGEGAQLSLEGTDFVRVEKPISIPGGTLSLTGPSVGIWGTIKAKTLPGGPAGSVHIESGNGAYLFRPIRVNGRRSAGDGGSVVVHAGGVVSLVQKIDVSGLRAGTVEITSSGDEVDCNGCRIQARGGTGGPGAIRVSGAFVSFGDSFGHAPKILADGRGGGGEVRLKATGYWVNVFGGGTIDVRGGAGIIEASAPLSLSVVDTSLRAAPSGCIALSAPTVDTGGSSFDVTPVGDCPGSPGGAFV